MADLLPISVCSSVVKVSAKHDGYSLHHAEGDDERTFRVRVEFATPFGVVPVVHVGLAGLDIDHCDSARLHLQAENITASGFDMTFVTWRGTRVYAAAASWIAIGNSAA